MNERRLNWVGWKAGWWVEREGYQDRVSAGNHNTCGWVTHGCRRKDGKEMGEGRKGRASRRQFLRDTSPLGKWVKLEVSRGGRGEEEAMLEAVLLHVWQSFCRRPRHLLISKGDWSLWSGKREGRYWKLHGCSLSAWRPGSFIVSSFLTTEWNFLFLKIWIKDQNRSENNLPFPYPSFVLSQSSSQYSVQRLGHYPSSAWSRYSQWTCPRREKTSPTDGRSDSSDIYWAV